MSDQRLFLVYREDRGLKKLAHHPDGTGYLIDLTKESAHLWLAQLNATGQDVEYCALDYKVGDLDYALEDNDIHRD